ncbi:MAG TPA: hypothetical protein PKH79_01470 [Prolixibacteraceae bacterium]|nr:hypothetical protein [Prolixibacteraceae bacterium]HPS13641.1 hypothetical protein [Prolixibacteraceae bacterium]
MKLLLKQTILFLSAGFISLSTQALTPVNPSGSHPLGMGNAFVSQYGLSAAFHNQAGLSKIEGLSVTLFYENKFLLKELSQQGLLVGIPTKTAKFALSYFSLGPAEWRESVISLACAKQLSSKLSAGIQFNYFGMKLPEENRTVSTVGEEVGFIYQVTSKTFAGIHLANPFSVPIKTSNYKEKIPYRIRLGLHSMIADNLKISAEAEKSEAVTPLLKVGLEWQVISGLFIRTGYNTGSTKLFFGLGYRYRFIETNLAFCDHQQLGITPSVSITFRSK